MNQKNLGDQNGKIVACERLARDYNVSRVELLLQYEKFKREHSNGEISKEKLGIHRECSQERINFCHVQQYLIL